MLALDAETTAAVTDGSLLSIRGRVDLYQGGGLVRLNVPLDGTRPSVVQVDETAATERTCTLNLAPDDGDAAPRLLPLLAGPLAPYGTEAVCYVDLTLPSAAVVSLPQGVFGLRVPTVSDSGAPVLSVTGRDRSQRVIDAVLTAPYDVPDGTNIATAIRDLVAAGVAGLTYVGFDPLSWPYTSGAWHFVDGDNRWQRAQEMAASVGAFLVFDLAGQLNMLAVPDPAAVPAAWTYAEGTAATVTAVTQALNADRSYSHASVIGQPPGGTPVRADAYDDDPASPTYWLGPFGDRPIRYVSPLISTQTQADAAAAALLLSRKGLIEDVTVSSLLPWAHEARDVVLVQRAGIGVNDHYVLSKFPVPLGPGEGTLTARSRRVA